MNVLSSLLKLYNAAVTVKKLYAKLVFIFIEFELLDRFHLNFMCVFFFLFFFLILSFDAFIFWKMIIFYLLEKRWNKNIKNSLSTLLPPHYQKSNSFNYLIINYYHNNHLMLQSCPQCVFAFLISCACVCLSPCRRVFCLFLSIYSFSMFWLFLDSAIEFNLFPFF